MDGVPLLGRVPLDEAAAAAAERGQPVVSWAPESRAGRALAEIAALLAARLLAVAA